jgi:hypothetical protein
MSKNTLASAFAAARRPKAPTVSQAPLGELDALLVVLRSIQGESDKLVARRVLVAGENTGAARRA